jgi:hypothetical protein
LPTISSAPAGRRRSWHGGPPPTHQPRFNEAEIAQARAWASSLTLPHGEVQRARLALLLHQRPDLRSPEAPRRLGQSTNWVRQWRRRWATEGFTLQDAPRAGRRSPSRTGSRVRPQQPVRVPGTAAGARARAGRGRPPGRARRERVKRSPQVTTSPDAPAALPRNRLPRRM